MDTQLGKGAFASSLALSSVLLSSVLLSSVACDMIGGSDKQDNNADLVAQAASAQAAARIAEAELAKVKAEAELQKLKDKAASGTGTAEGQVPGVAGTSGSGATAPAAPGTPGEYDLSVINAMPSDCRSPSVMLAGVPHAMADKDDFVWAFAVQALFAHPEFKLVQRAALSEENQVAFEQAQVNSSATGLVAYCKDGATCNRLAAMYKTTVPTSRPEVYCGKKWDKGRVPEGFGNALSLQAVAKKKLAKEAGSMCARIGVCKKRLNPALEGDPGVECQRKPSEAKYQCGKKDTCEEVVKCTES